MRNIRPQPVHQPFVIGLPDLLVFSDIPFDPDGPILTGFASLLHIAADPFFSVGADLDAVPRDHRFIETDGRQALFCIV